MVAVFKSMLVAVALLMVSFGAAEAVWARFEFLPNKWALDRSKGPRNGEIEKFVPDRSPTSVEAKLFAPNQAFSDHIWVNARLAQAPKYVSNWQTRSQFEVLQVAAAAAHERKLADEQKALAAKKASELAKSSVVNTTEIKSGRPRFYFLPSVCRFGSAGGRSAPVLPPTASDCNRIQY